MASAPSRNGLALQMCATTLWHLTCSLKMIGTCLRPKSVGSNVYLSIVTKTNRISWNSIALIFAIVVELLAQCSVSHAVHSEVQFFRRRPLRCSTMMRFVASYWSPPPSLLAPGLVFIFSVVLLGALSRNMDHLVVISYTFTDLDASRYIHVDT